MTGVLWLNTGGEGLYSRKARGLSKNFINDTVVNSEEINPYYIISFLEVFNGKSCKEKANGRYLEDKEVV